MKEENIIVAKRSKKKFMESDAQTLMECAITKESPGTVLKDLNSLIKYIKIHHITITKTTNYFSLKYLRSFNDLLSKPIKIDLKRPQQKSYPNIMGLYLLLRSIGLVTFQQFGKEICIQIDNDIYDLWSNLNDTEAYFTLLEAWLIRTDPKDVLDEFHSVYGLLLTECFEFWSQITQNGLKVDKNKAESFKYFPGLYNISLLELFGLIDIKHGEPLKGRGWKINGIKRNAFGDAFFRYVYKYLINTDNYFHFCMFNTAQTKYKIPFGQLHGHFVTFFPEWKSNLNIPKPIFKSGTYIFKVSIDKAWGRIAIDSEKNLDVLANAILDTFDFERDHLYAFYMKDRFGNSHEVNCPESEDGPFADQFKIGDIPIEIGSFMKFIFDFFDYWEFELQLEEINKSDIKLKYAKIIEAHGTAPKQYWDWDEDE